MEPLIIFALIVILLVGWIYLRDRLNHLEYRIKELSSRLELQERRAVAPTEPPPVPAVAPVAPRVSRPLAPAVAPPVVPIVPKPPAVMPPAPIPSQPASPALTEAWEARLGGNWLNKIGVFVLVVGIALALGYSFTRVGPLGLVAISVAVSLAMLISGAVLERRERYRIFARGLLGGGWAALYITAFAAHAINAAKVIDSPLIGALMLLAVAAGMIGHSLRYRSQTVTGLAYFVAFGSLAIVQVNTLPFLALVPLAASLLYVAHRFAWSRMALFGLLANYGVCLLRGDTGAPLWQVQAIFAVYWLTFEIFDILHPEAWLLPLNAAGFLGLSLLKWQSAAPDALWMFLGAAAAAYLVSAILRIRSTRWHGAATLAVALVAAALFQKLDHQWIASALVVEAELVYLAGVRMRVPYLRWLGTGLFGVELLRFIGSDVWTLPLAAWTPVAALNAALFYANRALFAADVFYDYAGAGLLALLIGNHAPQQYRSVAWLLLAALLFASGWWRRWFDFRLQGYLVLMLGLLGVAFDPRILPLSVAAATCYAGILCALWSIAGRLLDEERDFVRLAASVLSVLAYMALLWQALPGEYLGLGWMALAAVLLQLGLRNLPQDFCREAYVVGVLGVLRICWINIPALHNSGPWEPRLVPLWAALLAYAIGVRARRALTAASSLGSVFLLAALWALLPAAMVAPAWAALALLLTWVGTRANFTIFQWQGHVVAALVFGRCCLIDFPGPVLTGALVIACLYSAQMLLQPGTPSRLYFSVLATTLTTLLLYYRISGSMLTVACGIQGVALLSAGFPLRDRVLRISGLALLLSCILKLFVWDLRHLETLPRIFSFIALGLILLAVSWIYTRFRERVEEFL